MENSAEYVSSVEENELFAENITIEECRKAIEGHREFRETIKGDLLIFNYDFCYGATFPDPKKESDPYKRRLLKIRRECRGLIFDIPSGKLKARRLHKFFNIGEGEETALHRIDFSRPFVVTEKIDGSLISPVYSQGSLLLASKNGPTPFSLSVASHYFPAHPEHQFIPFFEHWISKGFSVICEWVSPQDPIVLPYAEEVLIVVAIRHTLKGFYVNFFEMQNSAAQFHVPCVQLWPGARVEALQEAIKGAKGIEGCVIRFDTGDMFKLKTEWYFSQSKSFLALPSQERDLWALLKPKKRTTKEWEESDE